ncbi:MAG: serine/threonine-protein kinase, partial [Planctomycetota bacterium]|nr:serine/threonine-protein kinase [Planctomycetota bacterium]
MYICTVSRGPDRGKRLRLVSGKTFVVGSGDDADLVLTDPKVLHPHCTLELKGDRILLTDKTASAGTYVDDKKIAKALLGAKNSFRIGDSLIALTLAPKSAPAPMDDPLVGKIVGGYAVKDVVGRGGMGTVYHATQLSLRRGVALKVLASKLAKDTAFRDLFINEARAAAQLVHPNVVQVYDGGTEGDLTYFSMEFMGAGTVEDLLQRDGKIPWKKAILQVLEAAHGLEYAEKKHIVHRDIKPDNLMINDDGRVKIADLGLAKRGESDGDEGIIGTPHFIPPEQALGKDVDTRADIYSLGATFFRMITGKTVFDGKTAKEIVLKHIKEPAPAASSVVS